MLQRMKSRDSSPFRIVAEPAGSEPTMQPDATTANAADGRKPRPRSARSSRTRRRQSQARRRAAGASQARSDRRRRGGADRRRLVRLRLLRPPAATSSRPTTPMCAPTHTTLAAKVAGYVASIDVADNTLRPCRRRDRAHRRRRLPARGRLGARQGRRPSRRPSSASASKSRRSKPPSSRPRRSSSRRRPARRARNPNSSASRRWPARNSPASRRSSRRTPTATRPIAGVQNAQAAIDAAARQCRGAARAAAGSGAHARRNCSTAQAKAERDLSFTLIRAPIDGVLGNRAMQVGDYVQTGTAAREPGAARRASISTPISRRRSSRTLQPGPARQRQRRRAARS